MPNVVNGSGGNVIPTQTIVKEPLTPSQTQVIEDEETLKQMVVDDDLMQVNGAYVLRTEEGEFFKEKTKEEEGNAGEYLSAAHVTNGIMARKNKNEQNKYPEGEKKHMIRIIVDAMGGDYAPHEPIVGAVDALKKNKDLTVVLVGDEEQIKAELSAFEYDKDRIDEILALILEAVCTARKTLRIAGDDYPAELVKSKFLKLNSSHIEFVLDCMKQNTTKVRNIKQYLRAVLFNAPSTIDNYYTALVAHDMAAGYFKKE